MNQFIKPIKPRILFIEDHSDFIDIIRPTLKNFVLETFSSPTEVTNIMDLNVYQLLLVDLHFHPDPIDVFAGLDFIKSCRENGIKLPIVVISNYDHLDEESISAGANKFLSKKSYHPKEWLQFFNSMLKVEQNE